MRKKPGWILSGIALLIALAAAACTYFLPVSFGGSSPLCPEALPGDTLLSAEQVQQDCQQLIDYVESVHPFFIDSSDQAAYQVAKQAYTAATEKAMTVDDFMVATSRYLTVLGDGHTRLGWQYGDEVAIYHGYRDGNMYYADENGLTELTIAAVDDVPMEQILRTIDALFPAENEMAVMKNYNNYFTSSNLLKTAGVNVEENQFIVTLSDGSTRECAWYVPVDNAAPASEPWGNNAYWDGDIFVVEFVDCVDDANLKAIAKELEAAVKGGCTKVIIDARGNGGGTSNACERLLRAVGMEPPSYGMLIRCSDEAAAQKGYLRRSGSWNMAPSAKAKQNENVLLAVLCDRYTYSSATMLCVYVRDGKLGTLIGEPSSNLPSMYGDITYAALENSHLYVSVSHKRFLRPSGETEERMLMPDIVTTSADAYQAALDYLNGL